MSHPVADDNDHLSGALVPFSARFMSLYAWTPPNNVLPSTQGVLREAVTPAPGNQPVI